MTQQTLDLIHRTYQKALEISTNHLEVSEKLYQLLYSENVVEEDCKLFDTFLDALRACIFLKNFQTEEYQQFGVIIKTFCTPGNFSWGVV